jgi:RHS repeat-associated protein
MVITENNTVTNTTYYINSANMELVNEDEVTYLYAEGKPIAMHRKSDNAIYYLHVDYQGSLMAISNEAGTVVERRSYDAWGRPRRIDNLEYNLASPFGGSNSSFTLRGYTFHEHLEMVGLINMNGRMYDPVLGRILSPDNFVQDATSTQNFNRYSYCLNNPTKYTDPDGNFIIAAILIGAAISGGINIVQQGYKSDWTFKDFNWASLGVSMLAGGAGAGVGAAVGIGVSALIGTTGGAIAGGAAGLAGGATGGFINGGLSGVHKDGKLSWNWSDAGNQALWGGVGGMVLGVAIGGYMSYKDGGNFWTGKLNTNVIIEKPQLAKEQGEGGWKDLRSNARKEYGLSDDLQYNDKQLGDKFGKHRYDYPDMQNHADYLNKAKDIYLNPDKILKYPTNNTRFPGEIHFIKGTDLLRIDNGGYFKSLYPGAY